MDMSNTEGSGLHKPGERCHIQSFKGTIRYTGQVPPTEGLWYGVEWDTDRGKNDGMVHGHRYFQCKENHGSFVRPAKLSFGVDVNTSFRNSYGNDPLNTFEEKAPIILHEKTARETVIDLVGFDKVAMRQSDYEKLKQADLSGTKISHSTDGTGLHNIAPNLKSLNLRDNLLSSLGEIQKIAGNLKRLQILNISENILTDWTWDLSLNTFQHLDSVYINKMQIKWTHVLKVVQMAPKLREIHACMNSIETIGYDPSLEDIEVLNLQGNYIAEWDSVLTLGRLKNLKKLILNQNQLTKVDIPTEGAFVSLKSLSLCQNKITEWGSVNIVNKIPSVTEFRFRENPVCEGKTGFDLRQELIARLQHVKILNGSEITERERKTAEMAYIKSYSDSYYSSHRENTFGLFIHDHPRYQQLANVHGLPDEEIKKTKSLKDNLISLEIKCPDFPTKPITEKKVPSTMTLQQLKGVIQRLYKVPTSKQNICYLDTKNNREISLDDNMKQLNFYSIASGDVILLRW